MSNKKLHPSVEKFKVFTKEHPLLIQEVRQGQKTLQEFYEDWFLLGEDDPYWERYKEGNKIEKEADTEKSTEKSSENWFSQVSQFFQKMDANQVQHHLQNLSSAIGAVQGVFSQFQSNEQPKAQPEQPVRNSPFSFRKD
ncbi:YlbD family protein [Heyndrickxia ginsengihumi]|uniref:Cytosolic protein n=1 Tax=Heyndrickxia ginsengihumi TaxID=363870 RepID=A0A0A6VB20_9BACI|nr:YlbD family protein [Heyndrickxia ginsengihumi]KHD84698.1 cytosolic protein [Heyndrickxia ginsengihumi]MBE6183670.1 cytosolic protein [Bacillus sp. (in: firmicutes)]MCM3022380.1 YlbD family protein [Heyndrickxia ginsengihumi]NEY18678.1 cytosolic protein [Heyndrickxia ginsengihumi]